MEGYEGSIEFGDGKKVPIGKWDITPIEYELSDPDLQQYVRSVQEKIIVSLGIPASVLHKRPCPIRWHCGLTGCHHATKDGAYFHTLMVLQGMP
jgi:hypothetical protein